MSARPRNVDQLLSTGRVRWAGTVSRRAPAEWGYREVAGRLVELVGPGAGANLTVAAGLVRDAQAEREPVAWVAPPGSTFHPPDLADWGVDLDALAVVRAPDQAAALRVADELLRSGAFGLVVVDGIEPRRVPMAAQVRLMGLAQQYDAALVCLCRADAGAAGSLASLRAATFRRRTAAGAFEYGFEVLKDKRRGRRWTWATSCAGPPGLR